MPTRFDIADKLPKKAAPHRRLRARTCANRRCRGPIWFGETSPLGVCRPCRVAMLIGFWAGALLGGLIIGAGLHFVH